MSEQLHGKIEIKDPGHLENTVISFDGSNGDVFIGGPPGDFGHRGRLIIANKEGKETFGFDGQTGEFKLEGDIVLRDNAGRERIRISGSTADIIVKNPSGIEVARIAGATGNLLAGGGGVDGDLILKDNDGKDIIHMGAGEQKLMVKNIRGEEIVVLGQGGNLYLGGGGEDGDIFIRNASNKDIIWITGRTAQMHIGANGQAGDLFVNKANGKETILLEGSKGKITLGGDGQGGDLSVKSGNGRETILVDGNQGKLTLGSSSQEGDLVVKNASGKDTILLEGDTGKITLGDNGQYGQIIVRNAAGGNEIRIDGEEGDIILENADCAEDFDIANIEKVTPGSVMVLTEDGMLEECKQAYDKKVAGVISGAGNFKPGLILDKKPLRSNRLPVALMGKVYCKVDAKYSPIEVGDILTTSDTPGYAMKAEDSSRAFGAVIGKALKPLNNGQGLIPILIALQ